MNGETNGNGGARIREVNSALIAQEERIGARLDKRFDSLDERLRRVERWAYAVPLTFLITGATVAGALIGKSSG